MRALAGLALAACYHGGAEPQTGVRVPDVRMAVANGASVRIVRLADSGLVVERTVETPAPVSRVFWVGPEPIVWLDRVGVGEMSNPCSDEPHDHVNELGAITARGYVKLPALAWPAVPRPNDENGFGADANEVDIHGVVALATELWESRCDWYGGPDGGWCLHSTYARRYPSPVVFTDKEQTPASERPLPKVAPPPDVAAAIVERRPDSATYEEGGQTYMNGTAHVLRCTTHGRAHELPRAGEVSYDEYRELAWVSREPPIFQATTQAFSEFRTPPPEHHIFEGCTPSRRYKRAVAGPHELVVLLGEEVSVLWHDREVGHLASGGGDIAFAPEPR